MLHRPKSEFPQSPPIPAGMSTRRYWAAACLRIAMLSVILITILSTGLPR